WLVEQIGRAIPHAHQQKSLHPDLKPANGLFANPGGHETEPFQPKNADFGLAKFLEADQRLTGRKVVHVTPRYMAPEQAGGRTKEISRATDIYALGGILYETLTGRPPFVAETRELTIFQVLTDEPVPPSHFQPGVPVALESICLTCLEKEAGRRYASAEALADDLRRFQTGEALAIETISEWERQKRWARRAGYELEELVGCSMLALVYKARQIPLNTRPVILKTIPAAEAQGQPPKLARFRAEAEIAARLHHPNITQIFHFGEHNGQLYFSLEFVDGG